MSRLDSVVTAREMAYALTIAMMAPLNTVRKPAERSAQTRRQMGVRR